MNNNSNNDDQIIIVSGYSGSGKTYTLKFFEALGYYCVDNLPIRLIEPFLELYDQEKSNQEQLRISIGVDIRSTIDFEDCVSIINQLKNKVKDVRLLFLFSEKKILLQRFQETRSSHPLTMMKRVIVNRDKGLHIEEAIDTEISITEPLRRIADIVIDTSKLNVHELKNKIFSLFGSEVQKQHKEPLVRIISFGFSKGIPSEIDLLFDVRFLPNPHFYPELRPLTGLDLPVSEFLDSKDVSKAFWKKLIDYLDFVLPEFGKEGKRYLTIGVGCTGGRHRSVRFAEKIKKHIEKQSYQGIVEHRDIYLPHS